MILFGVAQAVPLMCACALLYTLDHVEVFFFTLFSYSDCNILLFLNVRDCVIEILMHRFNMA